MKFITPWLAWAAAQMLDTDIESLVDQDVLFMSTKLDSKLSHYINSYFIPTTGFNDTVLALAKNPKTQGHLRDVRMKMKQVPFYRNVASIYIKGCQTATAQWPSCYIRVHEQLTDQGRKLLGSSFRQLIADPESWYTIGGELCGLYAHMLELDKSRRNNFCVTLAFLAKRSHAVLMSPPGAGANNLSSVVQDNLKPDVIQADVDSLNSQNHVIDSITQSLGARSLLPHSILRLPHFVSGLVHRKPTTTTTTQATTTKRAVATTKTIKRPIATTKAAAEPTTTQQPLDDMDARIKTILKPGEQSPARKNIPFTRDVGEKAIESMWGAEATVDANARVASLKEQTRTRREQMALLDRLRTRVGWMLSKNYVNVQQQEIIKAIQTSRNMNNAWLGIHGLVHHMMMEFVHLQAVLIKIGQT